MVEGHGDGNPPPDITPEQQALYARLHKFKEQLKFQLDTIIGKAIDDYTKLHFEDHLPVEEFMSLMNASSVAATNVTLKNLLLAATFYNNRDIGRDHINAMMNDFERSSEDLDKLRDDLAGFLSENTTVHSVH